MSLAILLARRVAINSRDGHRIYRALNPRKINVSIVQKQWLYSSGNCSKGVCRSRASSSDNQAKIANPSTTTNSVSPSNALQKRPHERDPTKWLYKQLLAKTNEMLTTSRCKFQELCREQQDIVPSSEEYKAWKGKLDSIICKYQQSCFAAMNGIVGKATVALDAMANNVARYNYVLRELIGHALCRARVLLATIRGHPMYKRCMQPFEKFILESEAARLEREKYINEIRKMVKK